MAAIYLLGHWLLYAGYPFDRSFSSPMKNIQGNQKKNFLQNQSGPSEAFMRH